METTCIQLPVTKCLQLFKYQLHAVSHSPHIMHAACLFQVGICPPAAVALVLMPTCRLLYQCTRCLCLRHFKMCKQSLLVEHSPGRQLWPDITMLITASTGQFTQLIRSVSHPTACCTGTPEAQGKADYVSSIVAEINHRKGFTAGLSQVVARAFGALGKRRAALHQVRPTNFLLQGIVGGSRAAKGVVWV